MQYELKQSYDFVDTHAKVSYHIPSAFISNVNGTTYLNVNPARCRPIGRMLLSRCSKDIQQKNNSDGFWYQKNGDGHKYILAPIIKMRTATVKLKFGSVGPRLLSRRKESRVKQISADHIVVTFPAVGEHPSHTMNMHFDVVKAMANGTFKLWMELTEANIKYLLHYVQHAMTSKAEAADDDGTDEASQDSAGTEHDASQDGEANEDDVHPEGEQNVNADDTAPVAAPILAAPLAPSAPSAPAAKRTMHQPKIWESFKRCNTSECA